MEHSESTFYVVIHKESKSGKPRAIGFAATLDEAKTALATKGIPKIIHTKTDKQSKFPALFARTVSAIDVYRSLDSTVSFLGISALQIQSWVHFEPAMKEYGQCISDDHERQIYGVDMSRNQDTQSALLQTVRGLRGLRRLPELFVIGLVSEYDVFLSDLIKTGLEAQPSSLGASEKTIKLKELDQFASIEEARDFFVEREIESILVQDHYEQLRDLGKMFNAKIELEDSTVKQFLEICERRNLFTHTGGIVSSKYVRKCRQFGIDNSVKPGTRLKASKQYLRESVSVVYELCIKLNQFVWRKIVPHEAHLADEALNQVAFDLIKFGDHRVAERVLKYAICETKPSNDSLRRRMLINYATAIKLAGDKARSQKELDDLDWSATGKAFKIAVAAIKDDMATVLELMQAAANAGDVTMIDYQTAPVFRELRSQSAFQDRFREIFKRELIPQSNLPPNAPGSSVE